MNDLQKRKYQRCSRCVMDTSDSEIKFDSNGVCNHCLKFDQYKNKLWFPNEEGEKKLFKLIEKIKKSNRNKKYDCILGLSGGLDSSYLALKLYELGINPLVIHIDAGWNSELATSNIESIIKYCGYDLQTHVVNWVDMKNLQLAYLKAGVSNQDVPQDHVFLTYLYKYAVKNNIKFIMSGGNISTEGVFPDSWLWSNVDSVNIRDIFKKNSKQKLIDYQTISLFEYYFLYPYFFKIRTLRPLNLMKYEKDEAVEELSKKIGFKNYPRKHGESIFTSFYQNYYLPKKFKIDKRLPHLSSLINSGQITRTIALERLKEPLYDKSSLEFEKSYVARKLEITLSELDELINNKSNDHKSFKNYSSYYSFLKKMQDFLLRKFKLNLDKYS